MCSKARKGGWLQTFTGRQFWPLDPRPEEVCIEDIAHSLSNQCRYSGHTDSFYSVAQHSVLVCSLCPPVAGLWGLLHDASEAYLVDLPRPLKRFGELGRLYMASEAKVMQVICIRFGLPTEEPEAVQYYDDVALATEMRDLLKAPPKPWPDLPAPLAGRIVPLASRQAEKLFLEKFNELCAYEPRQGVPPGSGAS